MTDIVERMQNYIHGEYDEHVPKVMERAALEIVALRKRITELSASPANPNEQPVAWVIPGDDNAKGNGFIDAMAWRGGEFTRALYAASSAALDAPKAWTDAKAEIDAGWPDHRANRIEEVGAAE
jgi:hypothetical protein